MALALLFAGIGPVWPASGQTLTDVATDLQLGPAPLAVTLTPEPALAAALNAGEATPMVLAIEGIEGATAQPARINVFVDRPDADNHTPTTDLNWVGMIQLLPARGRVRRMGIGFVMPNIRYSDFGRSIVITLVPVVGVDNSAPRDLALRIARLFLRELR